MARIHLMMIVAMYALVTLACASTPDPAPEAVSPMAPAATPGWIEEPYIEGGFAATECVKNIAGQRSMLVKKATTLARAEIANQVDVQVKEMTKVYRDMVEVAEGNAISESIEQVLKTVTDQQLMGARRSKTAYHDFADGVEYLCVMVELDPAQTESFYNALIGESGVGDRISPQQNDVMYHRFRASQGQAELKEETGG
jgi:hypothetical protein